MDQSLARSQYTSFDLLVAGQKEALELALDDAPFDAVLTAIVRTAREQTGEGSFGAIFVLEPDGTRLRLGASAKVPEAYVRAVEDFPIGPNVPPCATAIVTGQPVIVEDLASNPSWVSNGQSDSHWQHYLSVVKQLDLRSCWSQCRISSAEDQAISWVGDHPIS